MKWLVMLHVDDVDDKCNNLAKNITSNQISSQKRDQVSGPNSQRQIANCSKTLPLKILAQKRLCSDLAIELRSKLNSVQKNRNLEKILKTPLDENLLFKWYGEICFSEKLNQASKILRMVVKEKHEQFEKSRTASMKLIFKNYLVMKKCKDISVKVMKQTKCKICEEKVNLDVLADHSFKCFELQSLRGELDQINRMILKIRTTGQKTKAKLRKEEE